MFNFFKKNHSYYYNIFVGLSRNLFFFKKIRLEDTFENKILILFFHFSIFLNSRKKKGEKLENQNLFDELFINLENHIRELGYGDVAVNKKMKLLTKIFYDILLKIDDSNYDYFKPDTSLVNKYFFPKKVNNHKQIVDIEEYFIDFHNYCFAIDQKNMINDLKNYKYNYGSS